jgi:hypothetical protein
MHMQNNLKLVKEIFKLPHVEIFFSCKCDLCTKVYKNFTKPHPKYFIFKNKTQGVELINTFLFSNSLAYITSVKGKNSADYFSRRAVKSGYSFRPIIPEKHLEEILSINISAGTRQGRTMDDSYKDRKKIYPMDDHNKYYGVFKEEKLVAYIWVSVHGELAILTRLLGHADYLKDGIMYLLLTSTISEIIDRTKEIKFIMYDTFFGASEGLKLFKSRLGFRPYKVTWKQSLC